MTATAVSPARGGPRRHALRGLAWVTWRQHRLGLAGLAVLFGGLGVFLLLDGLSLRHSYTSFGLRSCGALAGTGCQSELTAFQQEYQTFVDHLPHYLMMLPGLVGVFIGAPLLAREFESGTFRFAWSQGRSRVLWIVTKLVVLGGAITVLSLGFSALFTWWYGPFDAISGRMTAYGAYEVSGVVFAGRALFGFALGTLLGLLIRRTVPAMAATGVAWFAVMWSSMTYLRPLVRQPITTIGRQGKGPILGRGLPLNADVIHHWIQNSEGSHVSYQQLMSQAIAANGGTPPTPNGLDAWMSQHQYSEWVSYLPNSWFWHFQVLEAVGYAGVAVILAAVTVLALRRRAI